MLCLPLLDEKHKVLAVIQAITIHDDTGEPAQFTTSDKVTLHTLSQQVGVLMANEGAGRRSKDTVSTIKLLELPKKL